LVSEGRCLGFLTCDERGAHFSLDTAEVDLLTTFGTLIAAFLERAIEHGELRRLNELKSQFAALASHELRTQVAAIYGAVQTIEVPRDLRATVDVQALDRILSNLLANAVRHGAPPFLVSAASAQGELAVTIEDRGGGVAEEFVGSLFERFTRGATSSGTGAGLGLSIAQSYARAHGGSLTYQPAEPHGARLRLILPAG